MNCLSSGSISALHYAGKLHKLLTQVFITVVAQAVFPFLSQHVAEKDFRALQHTYFMTLKRLLLLLIPISTGILFLAKPAVALVFQRGAFTADAASATAGAWMAYTLALPVQAIRHFTIRLFNAFQDNMPLLYLEGATGW